MKKYRVTVWCEQKCWDKATIEIEAPTRAAAKRAARKLAKDDDIDYAPARAETFQSTGRYDVSEIEEI